MKRIILDIISPPAYLLLSAFIEQYQDTKKCFVKITKEYYETYVGTIKNEYDLKNELDELFGIKISFSCNNETISVFAVFDEVGFDDEYIYALFNKTSLYLIEK